MALPQQAAPTTIGEAQQERRAQQAPHHSVKKGKEQAGSSSLQLGGGSTPAAATPAAVRCTLQPTSPATLGTPHMHRQARDLPFGAGHEQAKLAMDPQSANNKQIILDDRGKLQARAQTPEARQLLKHRTTHMHRPAQDLPFGAGHEQAKLAINPMPATNKQINSDDREKLQKCAQAPEARQQLKAHGGNTLIKLQRLTRNAPHLPRADGYVQAGSSGLQLRGESMSHATLGQNTLQSTQHTTHAKPRLPRKHVPTNMPAKEGMGQHQSSHDKGDLQKKNPAGFFGVRRHAKAAAPMQQTHDPTTSATPSVSARSRAARDPPPGAGHEQPKAGTVVLEMGQSPLGGTFPAVLSSAPQKSGGARFKIPTLKPVSNHPGEHALNGDDVSSAILICDRQNPSQAQQPMTHAMLTTHAMLSPQQAATATVGYMPPHQDCIDIADFLAQDFVTETRSGLSLTPEGTEHHLRLHNNTCGHLVERLTAMLLRTDIPASERHTLGLLSKISQHIILEIWPGERLRRATTMRVDCLLGELAEFEARRLDFIISTRATLVEVCENLYNPEGASTATHLPQCVHFLDLKLTVTWIQVALPENLTDPRLQRATLHQTLGLLGGINKIFLFKTRPEGFVIFDGNLHLPNIDGIMTPQGIWIGINNPHHPSAPISTASSPHYPTWRPGIGSRVTLVGKHCEVTVIAIEKKHWPEEWVYLIWREDVYRLPSILHSLLYRKELMPGDNSYRIKPTALQPADGEVAYFFNNFEELTKVTVIRLNRPGFFDTIRLVLTPDGQLSRDIFQTISCHRLFQLSETPALDPLHARIRHDSAKLLELTPQAEMSREQTTGPGAVIMDIAPSQDSQKPLTPFDSTPMFSTNWNKNPRPQRSRDQTPIEAGPRAMITETVPSQKSPKLSAPFHLTSAGSSHPHKAPRAKRGRAKLESERAPSPEHDSTVVITKKRRTGGIPIPLILVRWRNFTIPCKYTDRLTPAMLIDAIRLSPLVGQDTLAKSTLTLPNNLSATLHLHATLCSQGISAGAVVTLMTRYAKVLDPHGSQHYIAYQSEDKIQGFIEAIQHVSPNLLLSELEVYHEGSPLDPNLQVQECDLPQEPSLQVRFRSHPDDQSHQEPVLTESAPTAGNVPGVTKTSLPPVTGSPAANSDTDPWPRRLMVDSVAQPLPNLCPRPKGAHPCCTLPVYRFYCHKPASMFPQALSTTLGGNIHPSRWKNP